MASLYVVRGRDQGKHFVLRDAVVRIGRDTANTVQLLDSEASRNHAEIRLEDNGNAHLVDLNSSNGTQVNGRRIENAALSSGDRIEIGRTLMIYTGTGQPAAIEGAHGVDIVRQVDEDDASQIVSAIAPAAARSGSHPGVRGDTDGNLREFPTAESVDDPISDSGSFNIRTIDDADRSLEVMYLTALAVGRTDDLDELLNRVLRLVFDWVDADRGCVMLRDPEANQLRPAARCDRRAKSPPSDSPINISQTILEYVIDRAEGVRTSNATDDERFDAAASIVQGGVREALCVPLQGRYDIVGALYVDTFTSPGQIVRRGKTHRFTDEHLRLITAIGHQAALAIEDTFYYSALLQSERLAAMGQTVATLSHHVKNILQGISGGSYLIESGLKREDTEAVRKGWGIVDRNQERISNLVMDMLTFSKERVPEKVEASLNETAQDVVELMTGRAGESGVQLILIGDEELPEAEFDPEALHQAILNLVTNAIDAVSKKDEATAGDGSENDDSPTGKVAVRTGFNPSEGWYVDVIDNGPGVKPEDRAKIFSLFESKKGARGTGLGLPVSQKIMREHGGDIQVLDPETGSGCCFRLRLPNS